MPEMSAVERLALDRASVRSFDNDGHLRIEVANISQATVNGYLGREIPGWKERGLDAERIYKLYRDPVELEKAASTFSGKPFVIHHVSLSADDHPHEKVIGAIGSDVRFEAPFLKASLTVWDGQAIELIESGKQRALSCAYRYTPVFEPGVADGQSYDARMTELQGNHLALCVEGRAGPGVVIGDSKPTAPKEDHTPPNMELTMPAILLSRKASLVHGAALGFIKPLLASDALPDLSGAFAGVTADNFVKSKPKIVGAIAERLSGKIAADKNLDGLSDFLTAFDAAKPAEDEDDDEDEDDGEKKKKAEADKEEKREKAEADADEKRKKAEAEDEDDDEDDKKKKKDKAEDSIPRSAVQSMIDAALRRSNEAHHARDAARNLVEANLGKIQACDSAEDYYRTALKAWDVKGVDDLPVAALRPMVETLAEARKSFTKTRSPVKAMDAADGKSFAELFPDAKRIRVL